MKEKKENIGKLLKQEVEKGHYEVTQPAFPAKRGGSESPEVIQVKTATGPYSFPNDKDIWKGIESSQKSYDREASNRLNYGDSRGRAGVWRDNRTALDLAVLRGRPDYLRCCYLAWTMAQNAPAKLQPYVYHNLLVRANVRHSNAEEFLLPDIQAYTFEVLPVAWRKSLHEPCPELEGVTLEEMVEPLTSDLRVGDRMAYELRNGSLILVEITRIEYNHRYSLRGTDRAMNPYCLEYVIKTVEKKGGSSYNYYNIKRDRLFPVSKLEKAKAVPIK